MIIDGTFADDNIVGTADADTIRGFDGNDQIDAGDGNDSVSGGNGDDIIHGGAGDDVLQDDAGEDEVYGGDGNDRFINSDNSGSLDGLFGGAGDDTFLLQRANIGGAVFASGGDGADSFTVADFSSSIFAIEGGAGNDNVLIQALSFNSSVTLWLGTGMDMVLLAQAMPRNVVVKDFEAGDSGDRLEWLGHLQLSLIGFDPAANIFASGHARLVQSGTHTLVQIDRDAGGSTFAFATLLTLENVSAASLTGYNLGGYPADGTIPAGVTLTGTAEFDRLHGTMAADTFDGLGGRDLIYAGAGDDTVRGGAGADSLYGHYGNDILEGGDENDFIEDGHGTDTVKGEGGNDTLVSIATGNDMLDGGAGSDTITVARSGAATDTVTANGGDDNDRININSPSESVITVDAGSGDDRVMLNAVNGIAALTLGAGADRLVITIPNNPAYTAWGDVSVADFATGDGTDVFEFSNFLRVAAPGWDQITNPFATGHVRLLQDGADTRFQISADANPANFRTIVTFQGATAANFTVQNLYGWPTDGSPPPGFTITGTPSNDTIEGTAGPDTIEGLDGPDTINAGAGNDTVRGGNHNDTLNGGLGDDLLEGDGADDTLNGGDGTDELFGGDGDDVLNGGEGTDEMHGGEGADTIYVNLNSGPDTVFGEGGDDYINLNALSGQVSGGDGDDHISVWLTSGTQGAITLLGGDGRDSIEFINGGLVDFTIDLGAGNDSMAFLPYNRSATVTLGTGSDKVGLAPAYRAVPMGVPEILDFATGTGGDYIDSSILFGNMIRPDYEASPFSTGWARLVQSGADTLFQVDLDGPGTAEGFVTAAILRNTVATAFTPGNLGYGTDGADTFRFDIAHDLAGEGAKGDDIFYLGAHLSPDDYLDGGLGNDTVVLQGDYTGGLEFYESTIAEVEYLAMLSGTDASFGGSGTESHDYYLTLHDENVEAGKTLTVYFAGLKAGEDVIFDGTAETDGRFNILGGAGDDVVGGGAGDDRIDGGLGSDILAGSLGNDVFIVDAGDIVVELAGEGIDEIRTAAGDRSDFSRMYTLAANVEKLTGTSATGQGVYGNALDNIIAMGAGGDLVVLDGGGNDKVSGGSGDDFLYYGAAFTNADMTDGGAGYDTIGLLGTYSIVFDADDLIGVEKLAVYSSGNPGAPNGYSLTMIDANVASGLQMMIVAQSLAANEAITFDGTAETNGSFNVRGGRGGDTITGGAKGDLLWGGLGADQLRGGAGNDVFQYEAAGESTISAFDTILDFAKGDRINLSPIDADGNGANGDTKFTWLGAGAFTGQAGQLRVTQHPQSSGTWVVEADINGDGAADLVVHVVAQPGFLPEKSDFYV